MARKILVVDDERSMTQMLKILFEKEGIETATASSAEEALAVIPQSHFDLVLSDIRMGRLSGTDLLREAKKFETPPDVILMTAYATAESAIEALKLGAVDYIVKPFDIDELLHRVTSVLEKRNLIEENIQLKVELSKVEKFGDLIGSNPEMQKIYAMIERIAPTNSTVLVQGESGTGKELVARAIHSHSLRKSRPFVSVNSGGIPETLLESELFGYVKGAFTGAAQTKKGLFDVAAGGTLFLDEIGEMSPLMQVKLLRAIQEKTIRPVGATAEHEVDVRLIAATNKDLLEMVKHNGFREDLYYRINVINIPMPPLRERREDIPMLVSHFIDKAARAMGKTSPEVPPKTMELLEKYDWPGNIRELQNVIERAIAISPGRTIEPSHIPDNVLGFCATGKLFEIDIRADGFSLNDEIEKIRSIYVLKALDMEGGNLTRAAKRLGITFRSIRYYVKKYGLGYRENS
ncbi:MAG TPA: sigma-54 dependent transcriptional regulator [Acidobacteriota bacterium]|nr:sigma-54 dependent transcriptional regulator [Acidobacteriota bacterium]HQQ47836.1 sigma-54 dependent transcriptional regulator [Acidobacteriota bacterium]